MAHTEQAAAMTCAGRSWDGRWHHPCRNKGKIKEDGKQWCRTHAPSIVGERRKARDAKWQAKWDSQRKSQTEAQAKQAKVERRAECYPALLEALKVCLAALESPEAQHILAFTHEREVAQAAIEAASEGEQADSGGDQGV